MTHTPNTSPAASTPDETFGQSPFAGKSPVSIVEQLDRKIESIPHDQVQATYDAAVKAMEANKLAPGAALKSVAQMLFGLLK